MTRETNGRLILPGISMAVKVVWRERESPSASDPSGRLDHSMVELADAYSPASDTQRYVVQLAGGTCVWLAFLIGVCFLVVGIWPPASLTPPDAHRHLALVASSLVVIAVGLAICVSLRAAVTAAIYGGMASVVACAVVTLLGGSFKEFSHVAGAFFGGVTCAGAMGGAAAAARESPRTARNTYEMSQVLDLLDVLLIIALLVAISYGISAILAELLDGIDKTKDLLENPLASAMGLLLGAPFIIAAWRIMATGGQGRRVPRVVKTLAAGIGILGAICVTLTVQKDPHSLGYGLAMGVLAGGLAAGLFALVWQWTDGWNSKTSRARAALIVTVFVVVAAASGHVFNSNFGPQVPTMIGAILVASIAGYVCGPRATPTVGSAGDGSKVGDVPA